jgi:hypothetical protein
MLLPDVPAPITFTPLNALPEITLPTPETPPMVLPLAPALSSTPCAPFGILAFPAAFVPMRARETVWLLLAVMRMPWEVLPEIRFWEPTGPPTILPVAEPEISMPRRFGMAAVPAALVPIRFPWTRVPVVPARAIKIPSLPFPEITLRAAGTVPPIKVLVLLLPNTATPWLPLPSGRVPVTSTPM